MSLNIIKTKSATSRHTRERELIFDFVETLHGHFSADDLFFGLHHRGQRVSRATVYRTLDLLVDRGMLQRVPWTREAFSTNTFTDANSMRIFIVWAAGG